MGAIADPTTVPSLIELLLKDPYVLVRAAAARALGQMKDPSAHEALEQAVAQDSESRVVAEAKKAAARLAVKK
jgi:HEAT repeat protein